MRLAIIALAGTALADIVPRQMDLAGAETCLSLVQTLPTPPPALLSAIGNQALTEINICSVSIPSSLDKELSSYTSAASSWIKAHSAELSSVCPFYQINTLVPKIQIQICNNRGATKSPSGISSEKTSAFATSGGITTETTTTIGTSVDTNSEIKTATGASGGSSSSTGTSSTAASPNGGVVMAVIAAAGAVVAAL